MGLRIFLEKCENLIAEYKDNCRIQNNGTVLLNPGKMPRSRHALYKGLEQKHIKTFLVDAYENEMPKEYLELIEVFNGLNLFTVKINYKGEKGEFSFACPRFMIFGIPRTSSQNRKKDEEEPFDITTVEVTESLNVVRNVDDLKNKLKEMSIDVSRETFEEVKKEVVENIKTPEDVEIDYEMLLEMLVEANKTQKEKDLSSWNLFSKYQFDIQYPTSFQLVLLKMKYLYYFL